MATAGAGGGETRLGARIQSRPVVAPARCGVGIEVMLQLDPGLRQCVALEIDDLAAIRL